MTEECKLPVKEKTYKIVIGPAARLAKWSTFFIYAAVIAVALLVVFAIKGSSCNTWLMPIVVVAFDVSTLGVMPTPDLKSRDETVVLAILLWGIVATFLLLWISGSGLSSDCHPLNSSLMALGFGIPVPIAFRILYREFSNGWVRLALCITQLPIVLICWCVSLTWVIGAMDNSCITVVARQELSKNETIILKSVHNSLGVDPFIVEQRQYLLPGLYWCSQWHHSGADDESPEQAQQIFKETVRSIEKQHSLQR
jgi:hypothetical protein